MEYLLPTCPTENKSSAKWLLADAGCRVGEAFVENVKCENHFPWIKRKLESEKISGTSSAQRAQCKSNKGIVEA